MADILRVGDYICLKDIKAKQSLCAEGILSDDLVVGELGGMGLIKNAVTQGLQAADRLAAVTPRGGTVVVVGAGPAGLQAAIAARRNGHLVTVYEKESVAGGQVRLAASVPNRAAVPKCCSSCRSSAGESSSKR